MRGHPGRPALNQRVPDDIGPGKPDQVGAAVTVSEYPPIAPELVEPAETAGGNPPLDLFWWLRRAHL